MDFFRMRMALAGVLAGAGAMFCLLTRRCFVRTPGTTLGNPDD